MTPLMQYKYDLTGHAWARPDALWAFRRAKAVGPTGGRSGMAQLCSGTLLVASASLEDLIG